MQETSDTLFVILCFSFFCLLLLFFYLFGALFTCVLGVTVVSPVAVAGGGHARKKKK